MSWKLNIVINNLKKVPSLITPSLFFATLLCIDTAKKKETRNFQQEIRKEEIIFKK